MMTASIVTENVWKACCTIVGREGAPLDEHASLFDMGLDSLGLAELVIQLEELYGEGAITIDDVLSNPVVSEIAAKLGGNTDVGKPMNMPGTPGPRAIFLFAGEGAHSPGIDLTILKSSPAWPIVDKAILEQHGTSAEDFLATHLGNHAPPYSPVVTTILNLLQADLWKLWGRTRLPLTEPRLPTSPPAKSTWLRRCAAAPLHRCTAAPLHRCTAAPPDPVSSLTSPLPPPRASPAQTSRPLPSATPWARSPPPTSAAWSTSQRPCALPSRMASSHRR